MSSPLATQDAPFGRVLTAMVTPFTPDGALDVDAAQRLASHLIEAGNDGLVVSGTTGESPTTTNEEDGRLLAAVIEAVGDRATVIAGVGTNDTAHSVELAEQAAKLGAEGLLVVTPYYNKPPQEGIIRHVELVAAAGAGVPVMLYDIPGRTGTQLAFETIARLSQNEQIAAVKDAVGDFERGTWILRDLDIALYSGDDALNLPWLTLGAAGVVSVTGHVAATEYAAMVRAVDSGDLAAARQINVRLAPVVRGIMSITQGAIASKAALQIFGHLEHRTVRSPLIEASGEQVAQIRAALVAADYLES